MVACCYLSEPLSKTSRSSQFRLSSPSVAVTTAWGQDQTWKKRASRMAWLAGWLCMNPAPLLAERPARAARTIGELALRCLAARKN